MEMNKEREQWLKQITPGTIVTRMLAGTIPMPLKVSATSDEFIHCGPWKFSKSNGGEIDEDIPTHKQGVYLSFIRQFKPGDEK